MHPSPLNAGNTSGFRYQALLIINSITTIITTNINIHCGFSSDLRLSTLKFSNADIERWPPQYHSRRVEISQISEGNCGQLLGQELHPFVFFVELSSNSVQSMAQNSPNLRGGTCANAQSPASFHATDLQV